MTSGEQILPLEEVQLVRRVAGGDVRAFEVVYDRYCDQVFSLALHVTRGTIAAEEATQDTFLAFWRNADRYDVSKGALRSWLFAIVRNRTIDRLRHERRQGLNRELDDSCLDQLQASDDTEGHVVAKESASHLRALLARLPAEQRQVLELAYFRGLTQREIASTTQTPLGTVKGRQRLAMSKLRRALTSSHEPSQSPAQPVGGVA